MAKHLHLFDTEADFSAVYKGEGYVEPWVSYTDDVARVDYDKPDPFNGHDYVDLGLPSGTLWATMNVGATKPEEYGDYFAWGETAPKDSYTWDSYKYGNGSYALTKYCNNSKYGKDGFADSLTELEIADDAARANWGGEWKMPTQAQVQELVNGTTSAWTNDYNNTGISGMTFTSKTNGKTRFVPAAGHKEGASAVYVGQSDNLSCSSLYERAAYYVWFLYSGRYGAYLNYSDRCYGCSARGVINPNE